MRSPALRRALISAARAELQRSDAPGASVALASGERTVFRAQVGYADLTGEQVLPAGARFPVYSLTKTMLAAVVLQLVDEGRLNLGDALADRLPGLALPGTFTVRQTLGHTAGLPDYGGLADYRRDLLADPARPWLAQTFLDRTLRTVGVGPAGTFAYSNVGYLLLRLLIEDLTGQPLARALRERLFAPLGLRRTSLVGDLPAMGRLTPGYRGLWVHDGSPRDVSAAYHPGWVAHGLVASTAAEVARLFGAIVAGRLVSPELLPELLTPVPVAGEHAIFSPPAYGLGLMIDLGGTLAGHGGGGPGYSAGVLTRLDASGLDASRMADRRFTAAALVNRDRDEAGLRLAAALLAVAEDAGSESFRHSD